MDNYLNFKVMAIKIFPSIFQAIPDIPVVKLKVLSLNETEYRYVNIIDSYN